MKKLVIGIDFDGTLVTENFPGIGELKTDVVNFTNKAYKLGHTIIIWTARSGIKATEAREFLDKNNVPYTFFNENRDCEWYHRGEQGRKLFCDIYLDDRAINVNDLFKAENMIISPEYKAVDKIMGTTLDDIYFHGEIVIECGEDVEVIRINEDGSIVIIDLSTFNVATVTKDYVSLPPGLI